MNRPRRHLFSRATLTLNQDRMLAGGDVGDNAVQLLHFRRAPHHPRESGIVLEMLTGDAGFDSEPQMLGHLIQQQLEFNKAEGLAQVVISATLHGSPNGIHGGMRGDHNDLGLGLLLLDLHQQFQAVRAGQLDIQQHYINGVGLQLAGRRYGILRGENLEVHFFCHFFA